MMQDGLHVGLAAWINEQRNSGSFPVYPASPIATELVDLESIKNVTDLTKAAEFARLVNFVPRQGQVADAFSSSTVLWEIHRDILGRMDFATEPWTIAEKAQYQAARDILYTTDAAGRLAPSDKLSLYAEMKNAYEDLEQSGGSEAELNQALADWMVRGHKQIIEDALETIVRLSRRSSRNQAENEKALLEPARLPIRGDGLTFGPTYFAPISAIARETWMEAKVSFNDLDGAVGNSPASGKWKAYLANRAGEVVFDYVVISCLRPWYTPTLYQADDWKLNIENTLVSKGNGTEGLLPAYVDAVYLVSVKNVTIKPIPQQPISTRPNLGGILATGLVVAQPFQLHSQPKTLGAAGPRKGVVATKAINRSSEPMSSRLTDSVLTSTPTERRFSALRSGAVRRLTAIDLTQRYIVAQAFLAGELWSNLPKPDEPKIYVAGFGCVKVPLAPNPNVNYTW